MTTEADVTEVLAAVDIGAAEDTPRKWVEAWQ